MSGTPGREAKATVPPKSRLCACGDHYSRGKHEEKVGFLTDPKWIHPGTVNHNPSGLYRHLHHHRKPFRAYVQAKSEGLGQAFGCHERTIRRWLELLEEWGLVEPHRIKRGICVHFKNPGEFIKGQWTDGKVKTCLRPGNLARSKASRPGKVAQIVPCEKQNLPDLDPHIPSGATTSTPFLIDSKSFPIEPPHRRSRVPRVSLAAERQKRLGPILLEHPDLTGQARRDAMQTIHRWAKGAGSWASLDALESAFRVVLWSFGQYAGKIRNPHAYASRLLDHYTQAYNVTLTTDEHRKILNHRIAPAWSFERHLEAAMGEGYEYEEACTEAARRVAHQDRVRALTAGIGS